MNEAGTVIGYDIATTTGGIDMARKGRKRKTAERHRCGKLKQVNRVDIGPAEMRAHRLAITGSPDLPGDFPLAVLRGRLDPTTGCPWITERQYLAGMAFAALTWRIFGRPFGAVAQMEPPKGRTRDPADMLRDRRRYEASIRAMHGIGAKVRMAVVDAAVTLNFGWCIRSMVADAEITDKHRSHIGRVVAGLDALSRLSPIVIDDDEAELARAQAA